MRRHVRHELDRVAEVARHFALVDVPHERIGHEVVGQLRRVVAVGRRGARAAVARHAEALRRRREELLQRTDGQLHRGRVAAGVRDAPLAGVVLAIELGQPVEPIACETMVRRQVHHQRRRALVVDRSDVRSAGVVRQREHHDVGTLRGDGRRIERLEAQVRLRVGHPVAQRFARELARAHEHQLERRMRLDQAHELGARVAAGADEADGLRCGHGLAIRKRSEMGNGKSEMGSASSGDSRCAALPISHFQFPISMLSPSTSPAARGNARRPSRSPASLRARTRTRSTSRP